MKCHCGAEILSRMPTCYECGVKSLGEIGTESILEEIFRFESKVRMITGNGIGEISLHKNAFMRLCEDVSESTRYAKFTSAISLYNSGEIDVYGAFGPIRIRKIEEVK